MVACVLFIYFMFTSYYMGYLNLILLSSDTIRDERKNCSSDSRSIADINKDDKLQEPVNHYQSLLLDNDNDETDREVIETVEVVFGDLKYRRVCTNVGVGSVLCMTIRYPFEVPLQQSADQTIRYPTPVQPKFYDLPKSNVYVLNQKDWLECTNTLGSVMLSESDIIVEDTTVAECLTNQALRQQSFTKAGEFVVALWTRHQIKYNRTIFHGIQHTEAVHRIYQFFVTDHEIIVTGASPSPLVTEQIMLLFSGHCYDTGVYKHGNFNCVEKSKDKQTNARLKSNYNNRTRQHLSRKSRNRRDSQPYRRVGYHNRYLFEVGKPFSELEEGYINIANFDYRLIGRQGQHYLSNETTLESVLLNVQRRKGYTSLRNMSLIVEYPIAHVQTENMILSPYRQMKSAIQALQNALPSYYMEFLSERGKRQLARRNGFQFQHLLAFDGLPQFYPTKTNGWTTQLYTLKKEYASNPENFTYYGWKPEYGRSCVGPLPSNSYLREINVMSRKAFERLGLDMTRWYGRTWEFANLFWFQVKMFNSKKRLDGTHTAIYSDGFSGVHKYFVQAMIDDYFENS